MTIRIKRVYDPPTDDDGYRVLVDRLWPRGLTKQAAAADVWLKEIAPSNELRRWYQHDPAKWPEFQQRYRRELEDKQQVLNDLRNRAKEGTVTLLFSSKERNLNNAAALQALLESTPK